MLLLDVVPLKLFGGMITSLINSPFRRILVKLGFKEKELEQLYIDIKNKTNYSRFFDVKPNERLVFLPQCLRGKNCKATQDEFGFHCKLCGKCKIAEIMKTANFVDSKVFVLAGGSMIPAILAKYKPSALIGVACFKELIQGIDLLEKYSIPAQIVNLTKDGCINTDVKLCDVLKLMTWPSLR